MPCWGCPVGKGARQAPDPRAVKQGRRLSRGGGKQGITQQLRTRNAVNTMKEPVNKTKELKLEIEELEQRIAPDVIGNPGNNAPGVNNTNNPGLEGQP